MKPLRVDVWSDIACPWCYIGKRRLEAALARFEHRDDVEVVWRAFELDPSAPRVRPTDASYAERIARKYAMPVAQAQAAVERMTGVAAADGLSFRFDRVRPGNTFDAHRLVHLAGEHAKQDAMKERLLLAYMTEGEAIGEVETLIRLAAEVGLDPEEARAALASDAHAGAVREDEAIARNAGITGVPFFVFGGRYAVSGAQPPEVLLSALERAWADVALAAGAARGGAAAPGVVCGPDGCA